KGHNAASNSHADMRFVDPRLPGELIEDFLLQGLIDHRPLHGCLWPGRMPELPHFWSLFFFNDTATTEIYPLSLHDALPICSCGATPLRRIARGRRRSPPHGYPTTRVLIRRGPLVSTSRLDPNPTPAQL